MQRDTIIALDFPDLQTTLEFLEPFKDVKPFVKVGMELYLQNGPVVIKELKARGFKIFLDLKLHDIPNTVYGAAKGLAQFKVDILSVHAAGGTEMLKAAKQGLIDGGANTKVIAITQLTSTSESDMRKEQNIQSSLMDSVLLYAKVAQEAGIDGVVSSVLEAEAIRKQAGNDFLIVTPGIRLANDNVGDQKRIATPAVAREYGSSHIVVGRPITKYETPVVRYKEINSSFTKA